MEVDVYFTLAVSPDGVSQKTCVGVGADRSFWMEPSHLGLSQADLRRLVSEDASILMRDFKTGRLFVNTQAVIADCESVEEQKAMTRFVEEYLDLLHPTNFRK